MKGLIVLMGRNLQLLLEKEGVGPSLKEFSPPPRYELKVIWLEITWGFVYGLWFRRF